jgi:hypothetical protein
MFVSKLFRYTQCKRNFTQEHERYSPYPNFFDLNEISSTVEFTKDCGLSLRQTKSVPWFNLRIFQTRFSLKISSF